MPMLVRMVLTRLETRESSDMGILKLVYKLNKRVVIHSNNDRPLRTATSRSFPFRVIRREKDWYVNGIKGCASSMHVHLGFGEYYTGHQST
jgi:hypothetical protein